MSHYAKIENGIVTQVIVAEQDVIDSGIFGDGWLKTSYNTYGNVHYGNDRNPDGGIAFRGNYASIGYIYDDVNDVFYPPRPLDKNGVLCESWTIGSPNWIWTPPVIHPTDKSIYAWDESTISWVKIND